MISIWLVAKVYMLYYVTLCSSNIQHAVGLGNEHVDHIDIDNWKISVPDSISLTECIMLCSLKLETFCILKTPSRVCEK